MRNHQGQRDRCRKYVAAAFEASGMDHQQFADACHISSKRCLLEYMRGNACPGMGCLSTMYKLTGICPDDYGIPIIGAEKCAEEMRALVKQGHTLAEFIKATRLDKVVISHIVEGKSVSLASMINFEEAWRKYNVPQRICDPEFIASVKRDRPITRTDKEFSWIERVWGCIAESAKQIRDGFWIWQTDSIYDLELELVSGDTYEFRGIYKATGEISTRREIHIS